MADLPSSPGAPSTLSRASDDTLVDDSSYQFFTFIFTPLYRLPSLPRTTRALSDAVIDAFDRLEHCCEVCYFLRKRRPIDIIQPDSSGGWEWVGQDNHVFEAQECPWRLLRPLTLYEDFMLHVQDSMRQLYVGDGELAICVRCAQPHDSVKPHPRCLYGSSLFMISFMVWTTRTVRDHIFSFLILRSGTSIPNLKSTSEYAEWLGFPIASWSSLRHIHLVVIAYRLLRRHDLLPMYVFILKRSSSDHISFYSKSPAS